MPLIISPSVPPQGPCLGSEVLKVHFRPKAPWAVPDLSFVEAWVILNSDLHLGHFKHVERFNSPVFTTKKL